MRRQMLSGHDACPQRASHRKRTAGRCHLDPDEIEEYVNWLEEDDKYIYKSAAKDYPGCSLINTWVAVSIPFSEAFLYALIIRLLLGKKERLISYYKKPEEDDEEMAGIYREYCCCRVHEDFARILHFKESVFTCLYRLIDQDTYPAIRAFFEEKTEKITDSNIMEIRDLTEKYSDLSDDGNDPSGICTFLEELKGILEKQG